MKWLILTGEYPPAEGGVADYTAGVAEALAARGEEVIVFAPATQNGNAKSELRNQVQIEWCPGRFGIYSQWVLFRKLRFFQKDGILLLQYVPHAFGWKGMNVLLCLFLHYYRGGPLWIMFHEVAYPVAPHQRWKHNFLGYVNRWMVRLLCNSLSVKRIMISTESWLPILKTILEREIKADWLPVPSNLENKELIVQRPTIPADRPIRLGHFGTYGELIGAILRKIISAILTDFPTIQLVLIGRGSRNFLSDIEGDLVPAGRIIATGELSSVKLKEELSQCDFLIQPFPDGISTRRTSAMAGLELGIPVISQSGPLTEELWRNSGAVHLINGEDISEWITAIRELINSPEKRLELGRQGKVFYQERFSMRATIDSLIDRSRSSIP